MDSMSRIMEIDVHLEILKIEDFLCDETMRKVRLHLGNQVCNVWANYVTNSKSNMIFLATIRTKLYRFFNHDYSI